MPWSQPALWTFVDTCLNALDASEVERAFFAQMDNLGFAYGGITSLAEDFDNWPAHALLFGRAPKGWMARYREAGYHRINPIHAEARRRAAPFFWNSPDFLAKVDEAGMRFLKEQSEAGVRDGFTIPIRSPGALPASCSLVPGPGGVEETSYFVGHSMAVVAHESARKVLGAAVGADAPGLTERERECLRYVAQGKSDWAISEMLGVSEGAVHKTIERAKKKLGVATRVQAVVRAMHTGDVPLDDAAP